MSNVANVFFYRMLFLQLDKLSRLDCTNKHPPLVSLRIWLPVILALITLRNVSRNISSVMLALAPVDDLQGRDGPRKASFSICCLELVDSTRGTSLRYIHPSLHRTIGFPDCQSFEQWYRSHLFRDMSSRIDLCSSFDFHPSDFQA